MDLDIAGKRLLPSLKKEFPGQSNNVEELHLHMQIPSLQLKMKSFVIGWAEKSQLRRMQLYPLIPKTKDKTREPSSHT